MLLDANVLRLTHFLFASARLALEVPYQSADDIVAYLNWKSKYGGMEASDLKRLKELEDENRRLKHR